MSLLERVKTCHIWQPENYRSFIINNEVHGHITHDLSTKLKDFSNVFNVSSQSVALSSELTTFKDRTNEVENVIKTLVKEGIIPRWRDEEYAVTNSWHRPPLFKMDRGASGHFGIRSYGVHVNGLVKTEEGLKVWVGKRSLSKPNAPGELDHIVAGGQPYGLSILENLIKEAEEEANIPRAISSAAKATGMVTYRCERPDGLKNDHLYTYDLYLDESFTPKNMDGEVEEFYLWPIEKIIDRITDTDDFKYNVSLVLIHFLIREGYLAPDEDTYSDLIKGMHRQDMAS
ncbi:hypothetical protein WH96_02330 [Kiloniella spongiae]|uniref:Nudix hydrolase domain-containing protein n=1 Tax=Kiloniella spongiae TaxID=1489064 RepID=A0A0H2MIE4_9PROT|nr:DUF4743 domain-containing protein [Kiloniella spongiae]KLN62364.1 hypothetical protein WH96_02330 [Kiloniella spongiae]